MVEADDDGIGVDVDGARDPARPGTGSRAGRVQVEFNRREEGGLSMDIDMSALRALEREKEISFPMLVEAIERRC